MQKLQQNSAYTVVVTRTVRAARAWRARYARAQKESSRAAWISPQILAWEPWLRSLWNAAVLSGAEARVLLSAEQELFLWQRILERDELARQTLSYTGLAELAQNAFRELSSYSIPLHKLRGDSNADTQAFYAWSASLLSDCRKLSCLPAAQLDAALADLIQSGKIPLPEEVVLIGFDRSTPSQQMLVTALSAHNCRILSVELTVDAVPSPPNLVCARTLEEEIACAAQWVRRELLSRPDQRIAVLASSSTELRNKIDSTFRAILTPSTMDIRAPRTALPYEFSLGTAMVRLHPVRTALTLLRWLHEPIPEEELSWLLVHGEFSSGPLDSRATLDRRFRERRFQLGGSVSFRAFRQWVLHAGDSSGHREQSAGLRTTIQALFAIQRGNALEKLRTFSEWRELFEEMLRIAELHLLKSETSEDYQALQRWSEVLNDFASLNAVAGPVSFSSALQKLEHMTNNTVFAEETSHAPVQVLGIPESAGLVFDAVWWLGAQASEWPPSGKAQPFIPWHLQSSAHMPYVDPIEDDGFAQRVTRRILSSGNKVVVSFALQNCDPTSATTQVVDPEIVLSPLVRQALPEISMVAAEEFVSSPKTSFSERRVDSLETFQEEARVPFLSSEVREGVRFLELQSACPFRAFAELRLGTRPLQETRTGLDAAVQGTLMHRVLQKFWEEVQSQRKLLQSTPAEHREILRRHIHAALSDYTAHAAEPWQNALLQVEAERMEERLLLWLEREKNRPEFTVMRTEDKLQNQQLGGISFQCRVDRIDETAKGDVLLDYKTGCVSAKDCAGERPDQPQLPAYAVLRNGNGTASAPLGGIAFAGLHPRNVDFTIIASQSSVFAKETGKERKTERSHKVVMSATEMQDQLTSWKDTLTRLAKDFRSGIAIVDPKKSRETCTHCEQGLICRVAEAEGTPAVFDEEDGEASAADDVYDN